VWMAARRSACSGRAVALVVARIHVLGPHNKLTSW
jgi:hypothetical protein